jgi:putative transposase
VETTEGAKFWLRVMTELKARGIGDVLIAFCDGLTGLPEAITAVWPQTVVQTCIVHLVRASLRWVNYNDRKKVAALLRTIYSAPTEAAARAELDALAEGEFGRNNPAIIRRWRDSWERVIPLFDFAPEVRKVIYTTNMIESINSQLRRATRNRGHFPSDEALIKVLYLGCKEMGRTSTRHNAGRGNLNWKTAINQFDIMFPGRLDLA